MKNVIITGISRGIGEATAKLLLKAGYVVFGTSTSGKAKIKDPNLRCFELNLNNSISINAFIKTMQYQNIKFEALINNAAILLDKRENPLPNVVMDTLRKTFEVNLFGTIQLTEGILSLMKEDSIIMNVSSSWGSFSDPYFTEFQPHYKMSKAALNMYSKLLSKRLEPKSISVAAFDPGWVKTDMGTKNATTSPEETAEEIKQIIEGNTPTGHFWRKNLVRDW